MKRIIISIMILMCAMLLIAQEGRRNVLKINTKNQSRFPETQLLEKKAIQQPDIIQLTPFNCSATEFYFTLQLDFSVLDPNDISSGLQTIFSLPSNVNATGYNPLDDYIYTISSGGSNSGNPLRVHSDGTIEDLGDIGLPISPYVGAFDPAGLWYVKDGSNSIYIIDLSSLTYTIQTPSQNFGAADWAYHYIDDVFYGVGGSTLYAYDPVSNSVNTSNITGFDPGDGSTYGAAFYNSDEHIYVYNNSSGRLYQVDVVAGAATLVFQGPSYSGAVDGCACPFSPPPPPDVIAVNDTFCLNQNGQQVYFIMENDEVSFANLDFSTFNVVEDPQYGSISFNASNGTITYTADDIQLEDSLVYEICCDGETVVCDQATIYILPYEVVSFNQSGPYCEGEIPDILGPVSNEGVSGSWYPSTINTDYAGSYDHVFTPSSALHPCAETFTLTVEVMPLEIPSFDNFGPFCQYQGNIILPDLSNEGIAGIWDPIDVDTDVPGDYIFTFTPNPALHPCGVEEIVIISIMEEEPTSFDSLGPYCQHQEADWLLNTSNEGVFGTWSPDVIQTEEAGVFGYTFTPDETLHPCGLESSLYVTIIEEEIPTFNHYGPYCIGEDPEELPDISNEGIEGQWFPSTIETSLPGEYEYTFVPDGLVLPCALETSIIVIVTEALIPGFNIPESICLNDTSISLPIISLEGISGSWSPSEINTSIPGNYEYQFIPEYNELNCIQDAFISITVLPEIEISLLDRICSEDLATYNLIFEIVGGTGNYDSIYVDGYEIIDTGNINFVVDSITSGTGLSIVVWDSLACTSILNVSPFDCDCPNMPDPSGVSDLYFCAGESIGQLSIDDPGTNYVVNWFNAQGVFLSHENPFDPPGAGEYMVSLKDTISGCESSNPVFVSVEEIPEIEIEILDTKCADDLQSYQVFLEISGGAGNYTQVNAEDYDVENLGEGNYVINGILSSTGVQIMVMDIQGCESILSLPAKDCDCPYVELPKILEEEIYYCYGEEIPGFSVQDPGLGFEIQWFDMNGDIIEYGLTFQAQTSGSYFVGVIQTINQCISEQIPIELIENEEIGVNVLNEFCENETGPFSLEINVNGGSPPYQLDVSGFSVSTISATEFEILDLMDLNAINLQVLDVLGCKQNFWLTPLILEVPEGSAGTGKIISCIDGKAILEAVVDNSEISCTWSGPDPDFEINTGSPVVDVPGEYFLLMTDKITGCTSMDSTVVYPPDLPGFDFHLDPVICNGEDSGGIIFDRVENGTKPYTFSIDGGESFGTDPLFNELFAGQYHLVVQDALSCLSDTIIELDDPVAIDLYLESPIELNFGEHHQIEVETNLSEDEISIIQWLPPKGLSCDDCLNPIADPKESTEYHLMLMDTLGCVVFDSILIIRKVDLGVYIPNVFSPNGDAYNDMFYVKAGNGVEKIESFAIYDRWGNHVFDLNNIPINDPYYGWDGLARGVNAIPGVYVYKIIVKYVDGKREIFYGDITLLR